MTASLLLACTGLAFLYQIVWKCFVYPLFFSPLSKVPSAHPLAKITTGWIFWIRYKRREIATIHAAHEKYGPVVRLSPNEISVNCVKGGIQTVYSGGYEKGIPEGNWYHIFANYGVDNMFSMARNKQHSARKRMLSNIYSKSSLQSSSAMTAITTELISERFIKSLASAAHSQTPFNMCAAFSGITMDMVTCYLVGLAAGSNFTTNVDERDNFLQLYISRQDYGYWSQEWPALYSALYKLGYDLSPQHVHRANLEIEKWAMSMCDSALTSLSRVETSKDEEAANPADHPVVYAQLKSAMDKEAMKNVNSKQSSSAQQLDIASELLDHLAAGFDTSGITLTFLAWQLSQPHNVGIVRRLRNELHRLEKDDTTGMPSAKVLDNAPYLQAVLQEALRLHAAIPGSQPRTTPDVKGGSTLGPEGEYTGIPGGVRISAQAWSLHRNPEVFPKPESFLPERWLVEADGSVEYKPTSEMNRWFWAFGSGGRMCVGSNLAIYQMKYIIYAIWARFDTTIVDDSGCVQRDSYTAPPRGHNLVLRVSEAH